MPTEEQTYRQGVLEKLDNLAKGQVVIDQKVTYTNGKVKRITIALVLLAGVVIGQNFTDTSDIIKLFAGIF